MMTMTDSPDTPLHNTFGAKTADRVEQNYAGDPQAGRELIAALRQVLAPSATAQRLFAMADQYGVTTRFLNGRYESVYVPEGKWIFVAVTPRTGPTTQMALMYAGALREAEQNLLGFGRPGTDVTDDEWVTHNIVKNVDIIKNICKIVDEIIKLNQSDIGFLDSLAALGHDELYKAFVNGASDAELQELYAKKAQVNIKEG